MSTNRQKNDVDLHVAERLKAIRERSGMSRQAVASVVGVSYQMIQKYEDGLSRIPVGRFHALCLALGAAPEEMFEGLEVPRLEPRRKDRTIEGLLSLAETYLLDGAPASAADCLRDAYRQALIASDRRAAAIKNLINEDMDVV